MTTSQIIGYRILLCGDVGDPVVGVDIAYALQVETLYAQPYIVQRIKLAVMVGVVNKPVAESHIHAFVCWSTE